VNNIETTQSIYAAFGRGDISYILGLLAEDVVWDHELPSYGVGYLEPCSSREDVGKFFAGLGVLDFQMFEPVNFLAAGDQVVAIIRSSLVNKNTGRAVKDLEVHIWTYGPDGLVSQFVHVVDRHAHLAAWRGEDA
jgi:ketosteroid isomerase-like protein